MKHHSLATPSHGTVLDEFQLSFWPNERDYKKRYSNKVEAVTLVTLHSCKGLEFDCVIVAGLGDLPKQEELSSEFRLMYVGMTRAKKRNSL